MKTEWKKVGKLDRRSAFSKNPLESLHKAIRKLAPKATEVSEVAVSPKTNEYLRKAVVRYLKKQCPYLSKRHLDLQTGMAMLELSPCDLVGAEDFFVYTRKVGE